MKRLWMIVSTLAIANVLAIAGFLGWLHMTDRLSRARFESVRQMLKVTVTQEQQTAAEAEAAAQQAEAEAKDHAKAEAPPENAAEVIAEKQRQAEKELQLVLRKQQELESLRSFLLKQLADLETRETKLAAEVKAFHADRERLAEVEGAAQFKAALTTLEAQKPRDAKLVLQALIGASQTEQVVSYLAKMDPDKRAKVIAEFVKDEPAVAADLLERIRTRGTTEAAASSEAMLDDLARGARPPNEPVAQVP